MLTGKSLISVIGQNVYNSTEDLSSRASFSFNQERGPHLEPPYLESVQAVHGTVSPTLGPCQQPTWDGPCSGVTVVVEQRPH